ncbi:MAG: prepilin-type N-terminal cleavage/methylation domain-containing protein [Neisseriaceae bacterium]|nr:prepilin-type N-terminal cleavage/methylation domain-containing protein [Neisseriaceae bacterium]
MCKKQLSSGFTLVEVMIVVAILAILSTIAIPSYASYMQRTRLTQAKAYLNEVRQEAAKLKLTTADGKHPVDPTKYTANNHTEYSHYFKFKFEDDGKTLIAEPTAKNSYPGWVKVNMLTGKFDYNCPKYKGACKSMESTDKKKT